MAKAGEPGLGTGGSRGGVFAAYHKAVESPLFLVTFGVGWVALLLVLSPLFGITWAHLGDMHWRTLMYMHGIFLPLVAILAVLVGAIMEVPGHVRNLLAWSMIPAVVLNGLGSIFNFHQPPHGSEIALWAQVVGFFVLDEIAIALIVGLAMLPRARGKGWFAMGVSFWAVLLSVCSAFAAAVVGHVAGGGISWGSAFYSIVPGWIAAIHGIGFKHIHGYVGNLAVAHSHEMLPAVMGGIVALAAVAFRYPQQHGALRRLVDLGLAVVCVGQLLTAWVYLYSAIANYNIPILFAAGPGGVNGLAMDDALTGVVALGSIIVLIGLAGMGWDGPAGRRVGSWLDPLRGPLLFSWVVAVASIAGFGYPIEFHETYYGAGTPGVPPAGGPGWRQDLAFTRAHLLLGFFLMPVLATVLLSLVYWREQGNLQAQHPLRVTWIPWLAYGGMALCLVGQGLWVATGTQSWLYFLGWGLTVLAVAAVALAQAQLWRRSRAERGASA